MPLYLWLMGMTAAVKPAWPLTPNRAVNQDFPMSDERYQQRQQRVKEKVVLVWPRPRMSAVLSSSLPAMKRQNHRGIWYGNSCSRPWQKVGIVQFIKGTWPNGERNLLGHMALSFRWWQRALPGIHKIRIWYRGLPWSLATCQTNAGRPSLDMVLLDELTYMVAYDYCHWKKWCRR